MKTTKIYSGLIALLLIAFAAPVFSQARVQVIHNSADAAAEMVDIWLGTQKIVDDFMFRTATPFIDAPANTNLVVTIAPGNSTQVSDGIATFNVSFEGGEKYVLVAGGLISSNGYSPTQPFNIFAYQTAREFAMMQGNTDVLVFHGSTDAPVVDLVETNFGFGTVVDNLGYGDFAGYLEVPASEYTFEVRDASGRNTVATFEAPLGTLGLQNSAITVVASGFLNPQENNNGASFGLWVALPEGGSLIPLPQVFPADPTARLQVIHNSADAAAAMVDVWVNGEMFLDNFEFRTATPFISVPAGVDLTVTIAPASSSSASEGLADFSYNLTEGSTYVMVANGIVIPEGYNPPVPFDLYVYDMGRETAMNEGNTDVLVFHGSTDAPVVDVVEVGVGAGTIVDNLAYSAFAGYLELPTDDYMIEIRDQSGTVTVASYVAPLADLNLYGASIAVVASGFLNPGQNNDGASFGLYVALPSGGELIPLGPATSVNENISGRFETSIYPNPARSLLNVEISQEVPSDVQLKIYNITGSLVMAEQFGAGQAGTRTSIDISGLPEGIYVVKMQSGENTSVMKLNKAN